MSLVAGRFSLCACIRIKASRRLRPDLQYVKIPDGLIFMQSSIQEGWGGREGGVCPPPLMKTQQLTFGRRGILSIVATILVATSIGLSFMYANPSQLSYYSHRMIRHSTSLWHKISRLAVKDKKITETQVILARFLQEESSYGG